MIFGHVYALFEDWKVDVLTDILLLFKICKYKVLEDILREVTEFKNKAY